MFPAKTMTAGFAKCRDARLLAPLGIEVKADFDLAAYHGGPFARQGQRHFLYAAQPDVAPLAIVIRFGFW